MEFFRSFKGCVYEMKRNRLLAVVFCLLAVFSLNVGFVYAEAFDTKNYDVQMEVMKNNTFMVTEDIKVNFNESRHGIYRYIPYKGSVTRQVDGKTVIEKYRMKISDVWVDGYEFSTSKENGNLVIQIGSADYYVDGPQEYVITYRCTLYDDENSAFDSLYWNILPNGWTTPIEASSMAVTMPKNFDSKNLEFIAGAYGQADMEAVTWSVDGTTITADTTRVLNTGEGVTMNLILPEGYFTGEHTTAWMLWAMMLIIIAAPLLSILLWLRFGRDPMVVRTVEFYAPEDVNPAELGYIIDGAVDSKDLISMIIYWANKGYLSIREDGGDQFTLIKKKDLPDTAKTYELTMFRGLFENRNEVAIEDLKDDFYPTYDAAKGQVWGYFNMRKENRIFTQSSIGARVLGILLMIAPLAALVGFGMFLNKSGDYWIMVAILSAIFAIAGFALFIVSYDKKDSLSKTRLAGLKLLGVILLAIAGLCTLAFGFGTLQNAFVPLAVILASILSLIFTMRMKQRTKKSSELLGKILGFKEFIRTAELDRIQKLVEETPDYFFNVLPYAYVFGLTDKWAKNFEGIAVKAPEWYASGYNGHAFNTWIFMNSFHHSTAAMQHNITVPPAPSGGGGGSFSGGGGFSGGGMGGGGGGSW
jgi:uncharacterized membrane protein